MAQRADRKAVAGRVGELLDEVAAELEQADLHYGHGTAGARDDAAALVFHALRLRHDQAPAAYRRAVTPAGRERVRRLVRRRIEERLPSAYLTGITWFAGHPIRVSPDVLVPRSPLAELCERGFEPWIDAARVRSVLDLGTGSGCIAIAAAHALPRAHIDAADLSPAALTIARDNIRRHRLQRRVRAVLSDVYGGLAGRRYDVIVSNPPYVSSAEYRSLPAEYRAEPVLGLKAAAGGLAIVARILSGARAHLRPGGILVVEVGDTERAVRRRWPRLPFIWLEFERGGGGVFLLGAADLAC